MIFHEKNKWFWCFRRNKIEVKQISLFKMDKNQNMQKKMKTPNEKNVHRK